MMNESYKKHFARLPFSHHPDEYKKHYTFFLYKKQ